MKKKLQRPNVVIILLSYNGRKFLERCIPSILKQDYRNIHILMVDNNSMDDSVTFVRKNFPQIEILETGKNLGFGPGFNYGLRKTLDDYKYAILLSNDIVMNEHCVSSLIETMKKDPQVAICTSLVLSYDGKKIDNAGGMIVNILAGVVGGYLGNKGTKDIKKLKRADPFPVSFGIAVAMGLKCAAIKEIGLFDESFFIYYDDVDLSWRAWRRGYKVLCDPNAFVYHYGAASPKTKELSEFILKKVEHNVFACYYKNFDLWLFILLLPFLFLLRIIGFSFYFFIFPRVAISKFEGILLFLKNLSYYRRFKQKERKLYKQTCLVILKNNEGPLISFKILFDNLIPWFKEIKRFTTGGKLTKYTS